MWSPSLNASSMVMPAPSTSAFASRHTLRCSSDRKKLRVVQSESHARRSSSTRFPTQTMSPLASGPGPDGSTHSSIGPAQ